MPSTAVFRIFKAKAPREFVNMIKTAVKNGSIDERRKLRKPRIGNMKEPNWPI